MSSSLLMNAGIKPPMEKPKDDGNVALSLLLLATEADDKNEKVVAGPSSNAAKAQDATISKTKPVHSELSSHSQNEAAKVLSSTFGHGFVVSKGPTQSKPASIGVNRSLLATNSQTMETIQSGNSSIRRASFPPRDGLSCLLECIAPDTRRMVDSKATSNVGEKRSLSGNTKLNLNMTPKSISHPLPCKDYQRKWTIYCNWVDLTKGVSRTAKGHFLSRGNVDKFFKTNGGNATSFEVMKKFKCALQWYSTNVEFIPPSNPIFDVMSPTVEEALMMISSPKHNRGKGDVSSEAQSIFDTVMPNRDHARKWKFFCKFVDESRDEKIKRSKDGRYLTRGNVDSFFVSRIGVSSADDLNKFKHALEWYSDNVEFPQPGPKFKVSSQVVEDTISPPPVPPSKSKQSRRKKDVRSKPIRPVEVYQMPGQTYQAKWKVFCNWVDSTDGVSQTPEGIYLTRNNVDSFFRTKSLESSHASLKHFKGALQWYATHVEHARNPVPFSVLSPCVEGALGNGQNSSSATDARFQVPSQPIRTPMIPKPATAKWKVYQGIQPGMMYKKRWVEFCMWVDSTKDVKMTNDGCYLTRENVDKYFLTDLQHRSHIQNASLRQIKNALQWYSTHVEYPGPHCKPFDVMSPGVDKAIQGHMEGVMKSIQASQGNSSLTLDDSILGNTDDSKYQKGKRKRSLEDSSKESVINSSKGPKPMYQQKWIEYCNWVNASKGFATVDGRYLTRENVDHFFLRNLRTRRNVPTSTLDHFVEALQWYSNNIEYIHPASFTVSSPIVHDVIAGHKKLRETLSDNTRVKHKKPGRDYRKRFEEFCDWVDSTIGLSRTKSGGYLSRENVDQFFDRCLKHRHEVQSSTLKQFRQAMQWHATHIEHAAPLPHFEVLSPAVEKAMQEHAEMYRKRHQVGGDTAMQDEGAILDDNGAGDDDKAATTHQRITPIKPEDLPPVPEIKISTNERPQISVKSSSQAQYIGADLSDGSHNGGNSTEPEMKKRKKQGDDDDDGENDYDSNESHPIKLSNSLVVDHGGSVIASPSAVSTLPADDSPQHDDEGRNQDSMPERKRAKIDDRENYIEHLWKRYDAWNKIGNPERANSFLGKIKYLEAEIDEMYELIFKNEN